MLVGEITFKDEISLTGHVKELHTFDYQICDFAGLAEAIMDNHILLKHIAPDDNLFVCDEYSFMCTERNKLDKHFQDKHKEEDIQSAPGWKALMMKVQNLKQKLRH